MGLSICFDDIPKGRRNLITDVPGVLVGHATLSRGDVQTGVTAVLPHSGNIFQEKVPAAVHVMQLVSAKRRALSDRSWAPWKHPFC